MRNRPAKLLICALLAISANMGCSSEQDKIRPPLPEDRPPVPVVTIPKATTTDQTAPTVQEQFLPDPEAVVMASEWIDTLNEAVMGCAKHIHSAKLFDQSSPNLRVAKAVRRSCPLFEKVSPQRLDLLLGLSNDLDQAVQSYAALQPELEHLYALLSNQIDVPKERFPELMAARKTAVQRGISDVRNGIQSAATDLLDGSLENPSVEALTALVPDPQTLVETATHLVNRFVTGPVWQALIQDVRYRLIKGHPIYQVRDLLVIKSARIQAKRIQARIDLITQRRAEFKRGQEQYWDAVFEYLKQMQNIAENLNKAEDYDSRLMVLKQLQRIPKGSRKEIRDRAKDWSNLVKAYVQAAQGAPRKP